VGNISSNNFSNNKGTIVTSALPYSNGEIHLGHIASTYLPADIFTRYLRLKGVEVYHVCASDDFGTPILIKAEQQGKDPKEYVWYWHQRDKNDFDSMGISFDIFSQTSSPTNIQFVQDVYRKLEKNGYIYENEIIQPYCEYDLKFLPDRYVVGTCPFCKADNQYSDICEKCGRIPDPIIDPKCSICGRRPVNKKTRHKFFRLSSFTNKLEKWLVGNDSLQLDVKKYVLHWINEGLHDWDITRDISWGITVPSTEDDSYNGNNSNKKRNTRVFYGWFDNHLCCISALADCLGGLNVAKIKWNDSGLYHFIGKDIVYHHYLFLPAIRMALNEEYKLPDFIPTRGHLMLANQKISKSRNWYISLGEFIKTFEPDYLRFYLASITSFSQNDVNFDWDAFAEKINNELVNNIGNFINRSLSFCRRYYDKVPTPSEYDFEDKEILNKLECIGDIVGTKLENNEMDKALREIIGFSAALNQYFQRKQPWATPERANTMVFLVVNAVRTLAILLEPFIPFAAERIWKQLGIDNNGNNSSVHIQSWKSVGELAVQPGSELGKVDPLFIKIKPQLINSQKKKLEVAVSNIKN
jgi:methionyl-tRNA synthetase